MVNKVPEGWKKTTYKHVCHINHESLSSNEDPDKIIKYLDIASISRTGVIGETRTLTIDDAPSRAKRCVKAGDTLVSTVRPYLRAFAYVKLPDTNLVASTGFAVLSPTSKIDDQFLYQTILSDRFLQHLEERMTGSNYPAVKGKDIASAPILLPPLPEQKKIAAILSSVDEAIEATEAVIEQTRTVKKGLLQELLTRGIGHTEFKQTAIGEIPSSWEVSTIGKSCEIHNQHRKPIRAFDRATMQGPYPYYGPTKILDHLNEWCLEGDYVLLGEDGDHFLKFDDWEMTQLATGRFNVNNHAHAIKCTETCLTKWVYYFFLHRDITWILARQGAGRYKLRKSTLESLPLAIPSVHEQQRIISIMDNVSASIKPNELHLQRLHSIKRGLLQDLLTGKVRVNTLDLPALLNAEAPAEAQAE